MKPKNFPARKLRRQLDAQARQAGQPAASLLSGEQRQIEEARQIRTKKNRGTRSV